MSSNLTRKAPQRVIYSDTTATYLQWHHNDVFTTLSNIDDRVFLEKQIATRCFIDVS